MPNSLSQYLPSTDYCIKEICTYGTIKCPWYWSKAYKQYTIIQNKHFNLKSICICNGYCILLVVYIGKSSIFSFFRETFTYYFLYSAYLTFLPCDKKVRNAKEFRLVSCGKLTKSDRANKTTLYIIGKVL